MMRLWWLLVSEQEIGGSAAMRSVEHRNTDPLSLRTRVPRRPGPQWQSACGTGPMQAKYLVSQRKTHTTKRRANAGLPYSPGQYKHVARTGDSSGRGLKPPAGVCNRKRALIAAALSIAPSTLGLACSVGQPTRDNEAHTSRGTTKTALCKISSPRCKPEQLFSERRQNAP